MSYLVHRNGFGKKWDSAEADAATFLSADSNLYGDSDVFNAKIRSSEIHNCYLYGARIVNSRCLSTTITGKIRLDNCFINCRSIACNVLAENSIVLGESRISGNAEIKSSYFKDLVVRGDAKILNWSQNGQEPFDGQYGRIFSGVWERPPRIVYLESVKETITESVDGRAFVGCMEAPISQWLKVGERFGRMKKWTPAQVLELRLLLEEWADNPLPLS